MRFLTFTAVLLGLAPSASGAQPLHQAPGSAQAIAVGPGNEIFAIGPPAVPGGDGSVFRWGGSNWEPFSGRGTRIAVDETGNPWLVNSANQIWRHRADRWERVPGAAIDIAAGGGRVFILGTDAPRPGNGTVYRWENDRFNVYGGWGSRIAVDPHGRPWLVNTSREIWMGSRSGGWQRLAGTARSIGIGPTGATYTIGTDSPAPGNGGIYRWNNGTWTPQGGYGTEIAADREGRPMVLNSHREVWGPFAPPPRVADFGYGTMRVRQQPARGNRPLLVVMLQYQDVRFQPASTPRFYDGVFFGIGNPVSVMAYFNEVSGRVFRPVPGRTRIVGPILHPMTFACAHRTAACPTRDSGADGAFLRAYAEALATPAMAGFDWRQFDRNGDGRITEEELLLVFMQALPPAGDGGGIHRGFPGGCARGGNSGVQVCTPFVLVGERTGIGTITHEVAHSLGMADVYGARARMNGGYTLMASTGSQRFHLDPWHKMVLGWAQPRIVRISRMQEPVRQTLHVPTRTDQVYAPLLLYDPARGPHEFLLVEFRNNLRDTYDEHVSSPGVVVWSVRTDRAHRLVTRGAFIQAGADGVLQTRIAGDDVRLDSRTIGWGPNQILESTIPRGSDDRREEDAHNFIIGAPDQTWGRGSAWTAANGMVSLRWADGTDSGLRMRVGTFSPTSTSVQVTLSFD